MSFRYGDLLKSTSKIYDLKHNVSGAMIHCSRILAIAISPISSSTLSTTLVKGVAFGRRTSERGRLVKVMEDRLPPSPNQPNLQPPLVKPNNIFFIRSLQDKSYTELPEISPLCLDMFTSFRKPQGPTTTRMFS